MDMLCCVCTFRRISTNCPGVEYAQKEEAEYVVLTATAYFVQPFEGITMGLSL